MKKLPAVLVLFAACFAQAETAWIRGDSVSWVRPSTIVTDSGLVFHEPDDALLVAAGFTAVEVPDCAPANRVVTFDPPGIRCKTADELSAEAQAAADAAAPAAEIEALPRTFDTGIAVKDDDGHYVELVPQGQDVVAVQISNSPLDPATRRAMKQAAVAAERTRRQEWRAANLALRGSLTNNVADVEAIRDGLTATSTAAQVRSALIATVRELRQAQGNVQELRRLVADMARENQ